MRGLSRDSELGRNCFQGSFSVLDPVQLLDQFFAVLTHLVEQGLGQEDRRLAYPELDRRPATFFQELEQPLIFFRREIRVELLSKGGNHEDADICNRPRSDSRPRLSS